MKLPCKKIYEIFISLSYLFVTFLPSLGCLWCIKASRGMIHRLALKSHRAAKIHSCLVTWVWQRLFYYSRSIAPKHRRTHFQDVLFSHICKWVWVNWMTIMRSLKGKWAWPVHMENAFDTVILTVATLHMFLRYCLSSNTPSPGFLFHGIKHIRHTSDHCRYVGTVVKES